MPETNTEEHSHVNSDLANVSASKVTADAESSSSTAALTAATSTRGFDDEEQNAANLYELDVSETNTEHHSHANSDLANAASLHEFEVPEANTE